MTEGRSLRVLMLVPPQGSSGPVGRIAELLRVELAANGVGVSTAPWGRVASGQLRNVFARLRQALRIRHSQSLREADVILVHTSLETRSIVTDLLLVLVLSSRKRPIVLHLHGGNAHLLGRARVFTRLAALLLRQTQGALVLSSEERDLLQARVPGLRCAVVSNPYVSRRAADAGGPAPLAAEDDARLLFVGRILAEKGALVAIEAAGGLRDRGRNVALTLVGSGPAVDTARALVAELGLGERVELLGHVDPGRLEEIYSSAHVFVFPTSWPEGFPTVISEAMAAGLPIVTTAKRGIVDHLRDGENAVFVPEHDPAAVSSAVSMLLDSPELRAAMSATNLRKVGEFAPDRVVDQYLSVLRAVAR